MPWRSSRLLFGEPHFVSNILILGTFFDCELANAVQGITLSLFSATSRHLPNLKHITSCYDMKWYDCIKSHHKGLGQVKKCFRMGKKNRKRNGKEKLKEKYRIEKEGIDWNRIE